MQLRTAITYTAPLLSASLALSTLAAPATAASLNPGEKFGTDGLLFTEDTRVTFTFGNTFGAYVSSLGLYEVNGDTPTQVQGLFTEQWAADKDHADSGSDWLGTCGQEDSTVVNCTAEFVFKANVEYALGLSSWSRTGSDDVAGDFINTVFSTNRLNSFNGDGLRRFANGEQTQQFLFGSHGTAVYSGETDGISNMFLEPNDEKAFYNPEGYTSGNPLAGLLGLGIDDRGNRNDRDFQDMVLWAQAERVESRDVPEPSAILGLTAIAGGLATLRRRRRS
ncbi:PEP-CTERM sorting domain-containing protein [Geitlerinema sp. P-1104]|uniref:PEP-CTERM sorting domain-containing protein n=1 Tax=Geitlerinema sp. P-1104 TaxID=2546230 RepID=UPI001477488C|nr:PEP-CTERM sorting domain-containing protein [Geitlerinema sp. P-1104]